MAVFPDALPIARAALPGNLAFLARTQGRAHVATVQSQTSWRALGTAPGGHDETMAWA